MNSAKSNSDNNKKQSLGLTVVIAIVVFSLISVIAFKQSPRSNPYIPATLWEKIFKPQEQNAFMRLTDIKGHLYDVFALPGSEYIWAVGNNGLIIHSLDGGKSWQQQTFPGGPKIESGKSSQSASLLEQISPISTAYAMEPRTSQSTSEIIEQNYSKNISNKNFSKIQPLTSKRIVEPSKKKEEVTKQIEKSIPNLYAINFIDKDTGIAVGDGGTILKTTDGGKHWSTQNSGTRNDLHGIAFSDSQTGVAVGGYGTILMTTSGGEHWSTQSSGTRNDLHGIAFSDSQTGVAVGVGGKILKTRDGGESWSVQSSRRTGASLYAIAFSDSQTGVAVGVGGTILKTTSGGEYWSAQSSGTNSILSGIAFSDSKAGVAVGGGGTTILKTRDGGESWSTQSSGTDAWLNDITFSDSQKGLAVGTGGTILKTKDGGESWSVQSSGTGTDLYAIAFSDSQTGVVIGTAGKILKTRDGGESWTTQSIGARYNFNNIAFNDSKTWVAVGSLGSILKTRDGGDSWSAQSSGTGEILNHIAFSDSQRGVAVGTGGTILKTKDGGDSWNAQSSGTGEILNHIAFSNSQRGITVGAGGTILKTKNGGESWSAQSSGTTETLNHIAFNDSQKGLAVGTGGTILKTKNGGESWSVQSSGTGTDLYAIAFSDSQTGVVIGTAGTILITRDDGESWSAQSSGTSDRLYDITFSDSQTGVAVGGYGTILKTRDGGESWSHPKYRRYPALWYWAVCIFFLLFTLVLSVRRSEDKPTTTETVADILASDRPIQPGDPDPLNFGAIARGLSRFMRNPSTEPPLTVAITGAWGTGKSSLMNLLYYDLKQYGFTPVWFNAWHHQKGEQLLASLYANIQSQAIPSWSSWSGGIPVGLLFRLNLFFRRSSKHWLLTCLLIALPIAVFTYLILHPSQLNGFDMDTVLKAATDADSKKLIITLLSGLPPLAAFMHSLRAFGINPTQLIALGSSNKVQSTHIDPSARQRFANEFKEVTECLELGSMVIFIDDLDRCSKENVVDILESINFLSVSGGCYIILGMDKGWVEVCIEQQFPEMTQNSHDFANEYLEKLINIDVPVPTLENEGSGKLLVPEQEKQQIHSLWKSFTFWMSEKTSPYRYVILVLLLAAIGISLGMAIDLLDQEPIKQKVSKVYTQIKVWEDVAIEDIDVINGQPRMLMRIGNKTAIEKKADIKGTDGKADKNWQLVLKANDEDIKKGVLIGVLGDKSSQAELFLRLVEDKKEEDILKPTTKPKPGNEKEEDKSESDVGVRAGQIDDSLMPYLLPITVLFFIIISLLISRLRGTERIVKDSSKFIDALRIWHPWVTLNRQTPRAIKRYLNRVRYIAMRYREETSTEEQQTVFDKLLKKKTEILEEVKNEDDTIDEPNLVALSAIFAVDESWIIDDEKFEQIRQGKLELLLREKYPQQFTYDKKLDKENKQSSALETFMKPLIESINKHQNEFGDLVFMDKKQREKFLDILAVTKVK